MKETCKALPLIIFSFKKNNQKYKKEFPGFLSSFGFAVSGGVTYSARATANAIYYVDAFSKFLYSFTESCPIFAASCIGRNNGVAYRCWDSKRM